MRLIFRKTGQWHMIHILSKFCRKTNGIVFLAETVEIFKQIFGEPTSLFNAIFICPNITSCDTVDFTTSEDTNTKRFKIIFLIDKQFKCLIFACELRSAGARNDRTSFLSKIEQNANIIYQRLTEEFYWLVNIKHDFDRVQQLVPATTSSINIIQREQYSI